MLGMDSYRIFDFIGISERAELLAIVPRRGNGEEKFSTLFH